MQDISLNSFLQRNRWKLFASAIVLVLLILATAIIHFAQLQHPFWAVGIFALVFMVVLGVRMISRVLERKESALALLNASHESLCEVQRVANLGSYTLDLRQKTWTNTDILDDIFGITADYPHDFQGWLNLIEAQSRAEMLAYFEHLVKERLPFDKEYRIVRPRDGQVRWVHGKGIFQFDAGGVPLTLTGVVEDITQRRQQEDELIESRALLQTIIDSTPLRIFWKDTELNYLGCNPAFAKDAGKEHPVEVIGKNDYQMVWAEQADLYRTDDRQVMSSGTAKLFYEEMQTTPEGQTIWISTSKVPIRNSHNEVVGVLGIYSDITERKHTEEKLSLSEAALKRQNNLFSSLLQALPMGVFMVEAPSGTPLVVNDAAQKLLGRGILPDTNRENLSEVYKAYKMGSKEPYPPDEMPIVLGMQGISAYVDDMVIRRPDGGMTILEVQGTPVVDENDQIWASLVSFADISERKMHEAELQRIAYYDSLTSLPNRVLLADRLNLAMAQARRRGQKLAVAYLDLDDFKPINDRYGHEIGDQVLVALAGRMKQVLREGDTLARLGGDEFVAVLLDLADSEASVPMLKRLLAAVSEPARIGEHKLQVSASIGLTFYPQSAEIDADQLMRQADQAMYLAKQSGKSRYHLFDAEQDRSVREHYLAVQRMRRALHEREFVLHYQPKVDMVSGKVFGAEALIRWQHPERGLLLPGEFLHHIEGTDLEAAVGEWVIESALNQLQSWNGAGFALNISVNISAGHLLQHDFAERLSGVLQRFPKVTAGSLILEIVETAAMSDMSQAVNTLTACRGLGVRISLDDFGTGYSSLTYLRTLPVDILKIDQSFVQDMLTDVTDMAIIVSVIQLAHTFDRIVIAEGVETLQQGEKLVSLGCRFMQGYGIARPMPAESLPGWIKGWQDKAVWQTLKH